MLNLLNSKEQNKIILLQAILNNDYHAFKRPTEYALISALNLDFKSIELNLKLFNYNNGYKLYNPDAIPLDRILHTLFNDYAQKSTPFNFIDAMMDVYRETQHLSIDAIIDRLPMTRQNIYKLIYRVNRSLESIGIKFHARNNEIFVEGDVINIVLQTYRYYTLHTLYVNDNDSFNTFKRVILSKNNILAHTTDDPFLDAIGALSPKESCEHAFFHYLDFIGTQLPEKNVLWDAVSRHPNLDVLTVEMLFDIMLPFLDSRYRVNPKSLKFDLVLLLILTDRVPYKNFYNFLSVDATTPLDSLGFAALPAFRHHPDRLSNFMNYYNLVSKAYLTTHTFEPIFFYVHSTKGQIFQDMLVYFIEHHFEKYPIQLTQHFEEADIHICDTATNHPNEVVITNIQQLFQDFTYQMQVLLEISHKINVFYEHKAS